jgi:hypothetical protein
MSTLTVTFDFATTVQSFTATAGAASTMSYDSGTGNPAGALKTEITGKNKSNTDKWARTLTYQDMGVPANSTITGITSASMDSKCTLYTTGASSIAGNVTLVDGATTVTLAATRTFTATDGSFVTTSGTNSTGLSKASSNSVVITINSTMATGNSTSADVILYQDQLTFVLTHTTTFSGSVSEAGSATDSSSTISTFIGTNVEAGSATDLVTNIATLNNTITEAATAAEIVANVYSVSISESLSPTDTTSTGTAWYGLAGSRDLAFLVSGAQDLDIWSGTTSFASETENATLSSVISESTSATDSL